MGNKGKGLDSFVFTLYLVLAIYLVYKYFKGITVRKQATGKIKVFKKRNSIFELVLVLMIMAMGGFNFYAGLIQKMEKNVQLGAIMVVLSLVYLAITRSKFIIAENGLLANQNFVNRKELKKRAFDKDTGDLVVLFKQKGVETREIVKTRIEDMENINNLIRHYKLGK